MLIAYRYGGFLWSVECIDTMYRGRRWRLHGHGA